MSELHFKNAVSMKQNRALMNKVLASLTTESENFLSTSESGFFFLLFEKHGSIGRWETKHFIGMP